MKSETWRRYQEAALLLLVITVSLGARAGAQDAAPGQAARPRATSPTRRGRARLRGDPVPPPAPLPLTSPAATPPAAPSEPIHLPTVIPSDSCRRPPPPRRLVRLALKPEAELGDVLAWISSIAPSSSCCQSAIPPTARR